MSSSPPRSASRFPAGLSKTANCTGPDAHPRTKDALVFGAKIFADGIAPVENLTLTGQEAEQMITNGLVGAWRTVSSSNARKMIALREVVPTATSAVLDVPTAEGVEEGYVSMSNIVEMTEEGAKSASLRRLYCGKRLRRKGR